MATSALAIILARAGSKGLPGKNLLPVAGRPCAVWTIQAALAARTIHTTIVSTDDPQLLALAEPMGAKPLRRPPELASDTATIDSAARHAAAQSNHSGPFVILYANVPVRPTDLIDRAVDLLNSTNADSVQSYAPVGKYHPWWTARLDDSARVHPWEGDTLNHGVFRRQDLPSAFIPDGGVIALTRAALMLELGVAPGPHAFFGRPTHRRGLINPEGSVIDIDSHTDLLVADTILRQASSPAHT